MLKVSSSLPDVAVLRGGSLNFKQSLIEGGEILTSLTKIGYQPLDVLIGKDGLWTLQGKPTDAHTIFTQAHTIVDVTRMKGEKYQELAKKMSIPLLFSRGNQITLDREDMYRVLRQHDIKVPETFVIRAKAPLSNHIFRELWLRYHTPLLVRPLRAHSDAPTRVVKMFTELEEVVREYYAKGIDMHILTYKKVPTTSIAILPHFRNKKVYAPLWVDSFTEEGGLPNVNSRMRPHLQAPDFKKEHIHAIAEKVYNAIGIQVPVCIDFIEHATDLVVVNVDISPSLRKESRFMQSLATTGVDIGHYVHSCIQHDIER